MVGRGYGEMGFHNAMSTWRRRYTPSRWQDPVAADGVEGPEAEELMGSRVTADGLLGPPACRQGVSTWSEHATCGLVRSRPW